MTHSTTELLDCVLALLTPLLLASGGVTDPALARRAALQAIEACGPTPLLTAAQITGFALTALDTLRLSVDPELPVSTKLRLRANANAMARAARQHGTTPEEPPAPEPAAPEPAALEPAAPEPAEQQNRLDWSNAMAETAKDLRTNTAQASPAQHQTNQLWISVLTNVANELRHPAPAAPRMTKAALLRSTLMAGNPDFHAHLQGLGQKKAS